MAKIKRPEICPIWQELIDQEMKKAYFKKLIAFVKEERENRVIYPKAIDVFNAFRFTPYERVKVVIIGQDPYHSPGTAHGLSFSTKQEKTPPSLYNIFQEIKDNYFQSRLNPFKSNNLTQWAAQGILMLNRVLTVQAGNAGSHAGHGWEQFTNAVIEKLNDNITGTNKEGKPCEKSIIYLLWGRKAQSVRELIDETKHTVLTAAHPSPYSANDGFFGCDHFTKVNQLLFEQEMAGISWGVWEESHAVRQFYWIYR